MINNQDGDDGQEELRGAHSLFIKGDQRGKLLRRHIGQVFVAVQNLSRQIGRHGVVAGAVHVKHSVKPGIPVADH